MNFIIDAHEDLAWNILTYGRDYSLSAAETRRREAGTIQAGDKEDTLLGWPDYQRGRVGLVFGTLFAAPARRSAGGSGTQSYRDFEEAHRLYRRQAETYHRLVDAHPDCFRLVETGRDLHTVWHAWQAAPADPPAPEEQSAPEEQAAPESRASEPRPPEFRALVGLLILMEGAEGVRQPAELELWWELGVRLIGPAWAGTRFCGGTQEPGPLTGEGRSLLEGMAGLGFGLDLSHMDEAAALQALDVYPGPILASHGNAQALLKGANTNRHLTDQVLRGLIEREGVIGVVPYNRFLDVNWRTGDRREQVSLRRLVDHIDYICQMAGDAQHVGLGSDFDGGFGWQSAPAEVNTIADLQKIAPLLTERGYNPVEVAGILGFNWVRFLHRTLPDPLPEGPRVDRQ